MKPKAQGLVLQLLSVADGKPIPVKALVDVAGVFEITANNLRVTLARLLVAGLIARDERGQYRLAAAGRAVQGHVAEWVRLEDRMVVWNGGWIGAHTAGLARGNRTALRHRTRALRFLGLRELRPDLWIRPDNLAGGVSDVRRRLRELGLEDRAPVFALTDLDEPVESSARGLWHAEARRAEYRKTSARIEDAIRRLDRLGLEEAMVETFLLGGRALRMLAFDPLLPDSISPGAERRALVEHMLAYDRRGRAVWSHFMRERDAPALFSLLPIPSRAGSRHLRAATGSSA